jgi:hypothetical protein
LTTPRSSKPPFADSADAIDSEIEVNQRWTLRKHSCKPLCPSIADLIVTEMEVHQRWALRHHSCKALYILDFHVTVIQLECADAARLSSMGAVSLLSHEVPDQGV